LPQFGLIREATVACNLPAVELAGYEADDLIATYARLAAAQGDRVTIVSSDKDLMQLVGGTIEMLHPIKNRPIREAEVRETFGVGPERVIDVQALAGDSTDNVPGVPGIGVKTAAELITTFGDLDQLLARASEIKQPKRRETLVANAELARISRELVRLKDDAPLPVPLDSFARRPLDPERLLPFLRANQFRSILAREEQRLAKREGAAVETPGPIPTPPVVTPTATPRSPTAKPGDRSGYVLVQDTASLETWIADAMAVGRVAFDTETTSLDTMRAELVG